MFLLFNYTSLAQQNFGTRIKNEWDFFVGLFLKAYRISTRRARVLARDHLNYLNVAVITVKTAYQFMSQT
jgi:hypothetical protein